MWFRIETLLSLFFPRCCLVCGSPLAKSEEYLCARCNIDLPRTNYHLRKDNPVEQLFWGKIPLERATAYFLYRKGSDYKRILHKLKYKGGKEVGEVMGRHAAAELLPSGFFEGVDLILPVPLHKKKEKLRGYNQSEWIARGISHATSIPIYKEGVIRNRNTGTQTSKSRFERWDNVAGGFVLLNPVEFIGRHVLIIDDVLTTGATITACASSFEDVEGLRISVLTLAAAER